MLISALLLLTLVACNNGINDALTEEKNEEQNQKLESEKNVDFKSEYKEILSTLESKDLYSEYALYDLDEDSVPEMIVKSGISEADTKITIYDIFDGGVNSIEIEGFGGHTNIVGATDINTIIFQYGQMSYEKVGLLRYNADSSYTIEIVKEEVTDPQIGYIPFEALKMYSYDDESGLEWNSNPDDENYWYINARNEEV